MKTLTANFETQKNRKTGASPVWIMKIDFSAGTLYLADQVVTITGWSSPDPVTKAWVSSWGNVDEDIADSISTPQVSDFSVDLIIDPDEATTIHDLLWSESVETIACGLYLWFAGLDASTDPPVLMWSGNIVDFEKTGELGYNVVMADDSVRIDKHPGRVLSLADYGSASLNDVGYQMTIVYGSVEKAPALRLDVGKRTSIRSDITAGQTSFSVTDATGLTASPQSVIRIDDESILITGLSGTTITSCVRGYGGSADDVFGALMQQTRNWQWMCAAPNGDVYVPVDNGDIYKQTGGSGNFQPLGQTSRAWTGMCAAPNGNVYAAVANGDIYMQTAGAGDFNALSQTSRVWAGMCAAPNGDVYAAVYSGDIYKQTGGTGNFVGLGGTSRNWYGMAAAPNGNIYACVYTDDIYMQTGGAGAFNALGDTARYWVGMCAAPNGDVFACTYGNDIHKQTGGTGAFAALGQAARNWKGMAAAPNGDVFAAVYGGDVYASRNPESTAHTLGALVIEKKSSSVFLFADHSVKSIDKVYAQIPDGEPVDITDLCQTYTGQSGASPSQELAGYDGMAVVTCPLADYVTDDRLLIDGQGYQDDGSGTITGSASALIERPDHVFAHFLYTYGSWPLADFVTDADTPFAADGYKFAAVFHERRKIKEWCAYMAFQCRCWFRFAGGKAYLLYRPDSLTSDKTIAAARMNEDNTTTLRVRRSPLDEVINVVHLYYQRDWTKEAGRSAYQAVTRQENAASIAAYGEKERPDLFLFDFISDAAMAVDLRDFYLARGKDRKRVVSMELFLDNAELEFADGISVTPVGGLESPAPVFEIRKSNAAPGSGAPLRADRVIIHAREY